MELVKKIEKTKRKTSKIPIMVQYKQEYHICIEIFNQNNLMTEKELNSLAYQLKDIYAFNKRSYFPINIYISNYIQISHYLDNFHSKWNINYIEESFFEKFENVVYLSPDATEILTELDKNVKYVIGGLVDRNRQKNCVLNYCEDNNIKCYRLPIKENIKLYSSSVLTVNQVFFILAEYTFEKNWKKVFEKYIPQRKLNK